MEKTRRKIGVAAGRQTVFGNGSAGNLSRQNGCPRASIRGEPATGGKPHRSHAARRIGAPGRSTRFVCGARPRRGAPASASTGAIATGKPAKTLALAAGRRARPDARGNRPWRVACPSRQQRGGCCLMDPRLQSEIDSLELVQRRTQFWRGLTGGWLVAGALAVLLL